MSRRTWAPGRGSGLSRLPGRAWAALNDCEGHVQPQPDCCPTPDLEIVRRLYGRRGRKARPAAVPGLRDILAVRCRRADELRRGGTTTGSGTQLDAAEAADLRGAPRNRAECEPVQSATLNRR